MAEEEAPEQPEAPPTPPADTSRDSVSITRGPRQTSGLREKRTPQRVVTAHLNQTVPLTPDDFDDDTMIAPGKRFIGQVYHQTGQIKKELPPVHQSVAESSSGTDTLALLSASNRSGQTISFKVKGIPWRAGFSKDFAQTPLGHAIHPMELPPRNTEIPEALKKMGIVIRTVNPRLQVVLSQLLPAAFRKDAHKLRGGCDKLRHLAIFYLPNPQSSSVGFMHEFAPAKGNDRFFLYIQTSVGKAPVAILDDVLKTLEAGLPEGETANDIDYEELEEDLPVTADFDFNSEVKQSMQEVYNTFRSSMVVHGANQSAAHMRTWWEDLLKLMDRGLSRIIRVMTAIVLALGTSWPMRLIAGAIRLLAMGVVQIVYGFNRVMLAIARSPLVSGIAMLLGGLFGAIASVFRFMGRGFALIGAALVALLRGPGEIINVARDRAGRLKDAKPKVSLARKPVRTPAATKPKPIAKPLNKPAPLKKPQAIAPGKKRELGFFEDAPIKKKK